MSSNTDKVMLQGQDAVDLWLQGRDAWNEWVKTHPEADVDFSAVPFRPVNKHNGMSAADYPFAGFHFPNGDISFNNTNFHGDNISFTGARFGTGKVSFNRAHFPTRHISFIRTDFNVGDVIFSGVNFYEANIDFSCAKFGMGDVSFTGAHFGEGNVNFTSATLGNGDYEFKNVDFNGRAIFANLKNTKRVKNFSFQYSAFNKSFELSSVEPFGCVVDLTRTKTTHQVSLEGLKVTLRKDDDPPIAHFTEGLHAKTLPKRLVLRFCRWLLERGWLTKTKACNLADIERLRRLKELSGNNKDHKQALNYYVMEMEAAHWHETTSCSALILELLFKKLSDYGRSELRPIGWMFATWLFFSGLYAACSNAANKCFEVIIPAALTFSAGQMFSLIPSSRDARADGAEILFIGEQLPDAIFIFTFMQSLFAILLLFLLGLSLRNRFRV